jgi:uncharacterized protein YggU (UPF0235/DUF167 family)
VAAFFRTHDKGLDIFLRLTPRTSREAIGDVEEGADGRAHLAARVRAVPEKGAANAALEKLVAGFLAVPQSSVTVIAGSTARLKTVRVAGDGKVLAEALLKRIATG